jgi:hypothetical protein
LRFAEAGAIGQLQKRTTSHCTGSWRHSTAQVRQAERLGDLVVRRILRAKPHRRRQTEACSCLPRTEHQ